MQLTQIHAFAATHHGLVTRATASRLGLPERSWYRAIGSGLLVPVHRGVVRVAGSPVTRDQEILAAVWAVGGTSRASHRTSAWLWDCEIESVDIHIAVLDRNRRPRIEGVVLHRPTDLLDTRALIRHRVPTTSPLRMLVDLGASATDDEVYEAMEQIIIARLVPPKAVMNTLLDHAKPGRHGVRALRAAIDRYPMALEIADSTMETKMKALVKRFGLPPVTFHEVILGHEVDFRIDGTPIILECDGGQYHSGPRQFEHDRVRDAELLSAGWLVVRFTWRQLTRTPAKVAERIQAVLDQWSPRLIRPTVTRSRAIG